MTDIYIYLLVDGLILLDRYLMLSCQPYLSKADTLLIVSLLLTPNVLLIPASGLEVASSSSYP